MKKASLAFLSLLVLAGSAQAQIFGTPPEGEGRQWNIRFVVDPGFTTPYARYRDFYRGERYTPATDSTAARWDWAEWDTVDNEILRYYKVGHVRLGVLLNVWDNFYVGVNYTFYLIQGFPRGRVDNSFGSYVYWPFISLSGSVNYDYVLPFLDRRFSLQPTLSYGSYQANRNFEGVGQEYSFESRLGLAYRFRKLGQSQIRLWANYQHLTYQSSETSFVFPERRREIGSTWDMLSVGAGLVWHISIEEDPEDYGPSRRQQKRIRKEEKLRKKQERLQRKIEGAEG
ncbi:MAG: hypothetical protein AAF804_01935 [Bacteroidota bacterium]